jgi:phosphoglycerate dehydrogenase-like enzyme
MGSELEGKVLGVIGFGRIGRRLAEMCRQALHMEVLVYDPYLDPDTVAEWGAVPVGDLVAMARRVDILSVHTPLNEATRGLVGNRVIGAMKPGAIVINTARGPIVDRGALLDALQSGHLGGAGLDVYDPQPPLPADPLLQMNQVVLTPHIASNTTEGRLRMGMTVVEDVLRVLRGEPPEYPANPQVWPTVPSGAGHG